MAAIPAAKTINGNEFKHIMYEFGLIPPVFVGNPRQRVAYNMDGVANFVRQNYARNTCFISHNPVFDFARGSYPQKTYYSKNFMDLDGDPDKGLTKMDAIMDLRKLMLWFDDYALPYNSANSGSKGYHGYLKFEPSVHRIDRKLTDKIRAIQIFLARELSLKTIDFRCAEARRITRIPETAHVDKDGNVNGLHCIPLDREMVMTMTPDEIDEVARSTFVPDELTMNPEGNYYTIDEFMDQFSIPIEFAGMPYMGPGSPTTQIKDYKVINDEPFLEVMKDIIRRPCIYRELVAEDRPAHIARMDACIEIRNLDFTLEEAYAIFNQWSRAANWHDQHNVQRRYMHVRSVFVKNPPYKTATCSTLKREGLCVGKVCPNYREGL